MFILGVLFGLCFFAILYNQQRIKFQNVFKEKNMLIENCEKIILSKKKENDSLKSQIKDMYKTIDEYTCEKNNCEIEKEVQEVTLKKRKNSKK